MAVLALDLGGTHLRTALALPDGRLLGRRKGRTPTTAAEILDAAVASLRASKADALREQPVHSRPTAIGISAPGPLDPHRGVLIDPPNLDSSLRQFPLAAAIEKQMGMATHVERDTQVAALGEGEFGAARGLSDYVYLTVSTGIGGGVVIGGRLMRGPDGVAGELGHITVDVNGPLCGCGAAGHLEAIASGTGMARAAAAEGLGNISAAEVAQLEEAGDDTARRIMQRARTAFAAAVVSIVDIFNPQRVVVGGGIALGQGDRLLEPAREAVARLAFRRAAARVEIVPAELGDDVGLVGALALVRLARVGEDRG